MASNIRASGIARSSVTALALVWMCKVPFTKDTGLLISSVGTVAWSMSKEMCTVVNSKTGYCMMASRPM